MSAQEFDNTPDERARFSLYHAAGLTRDAIAVVEEMISVANGRRVGKGALGNVITRIDSKKNREPRELESHTCELVHAYELEFDPEVVAYYTQVPLRGVVRTLPDGRKHVSSGHLDFLVIREFGVELVECKQLDWLRKHEGLDSGWTRRDGRWVCHPYEAWAQQRGLSFQVWVAPEYPGIYLQSLAAAYAALGQTKTAYEREICGAALEVLSRGGATLPALAKEVPGFGIRHALLLMAESKAFGPWRSISVTDEVRFHLFLEKDRAAHMEQEHAAHASARMASIADLQDPILCASSTDFRNGKRRLERLQSIEEGREPRTRRMDALMRRVDQARREGGPSLAACLTNFGKSGNRVRRISGEHVLLITKMIEEVWNKGKVRRPIDLELLYLDECRAAGLEEIGLSTLRIERRRSDPTRHALATGGMRGYQSVRPHTDARRRSLPALGFGQIAHIDSTPLDLRMVQYVNGEREVLPLGAVFYGAVDSATGMPLGFSFVFGSPRTDGLAILFRDIARRNGFIPSMIHVDRGSENRSKWLQEFCCDIGIRYSPTAGSAWNSSAESMLKFVNTQVAQRLLGSTLPDRRGRSADGRYKSRRTARLEFSVIYKQIEEYLFTNLANQPQKGVSPAESRIHLLSAQGNLAIPTVVDEPFLIRTSVPLDHKPSITDRRSIRIGEGTFTSQELSDMSLEGRSIEQARLDCEDAKVLYLKMGDCWLKAFHQRVQSYASENDVGAQIFDLCMDPIDRVSDRRIKRESSARLRRRVHEMNQVPTRTPPPPIAPVIGEKAEERRATEQRPSADIDPCDEVEE